MVKLKRLTEEDYKIVNVMTPEVKEHFEKVLVSKECVAFMTRMLDKYSDK